jgi:hypothetical protein
VKIRWIACLLIALVAMPAFAQSNLALPTQTSGNTTVLPLWNTSSGQVDALLLIEPSALPTTPSQRVIRPANTLQLRAGLSLEANPGMGVLCNDASIADGLSTLAGHCMLVNVGPGRGSARGSATGLLQLQRGKASLTGGLGVGTETFGLGGTSIGKQAADRRLLESLLGPGQASLDRRNASLIGQISIGKQSWVNIGGTLARVRLIPTQQMHGGLPPEWDAGSLSLGGGVGNFGGELTGQMIEVPGQPSRYTTLGAGVTWRTPWKAKLSVGAENLMSRGKNPFGVQDARPVRGDDDEGRVPYVRYQQDL